MRKLVWLAWGLLFVCFRAEAQSNTITVQVVAPPSWTITVAPGSYYQNKAATMTITVTAGPVASGCTATWDTLALPLTFPNPIPATNPVVITAAVSAAMTAATGNHSVILTCPLPQLSMNSPVILPNAQQGVAYSANLAALSKLSGGVPPYSWTLTSGALPTGLSLQLSGIVTGLPSGAGSFSFQYSVADASGSALLVDVSGRLLALHPTMLTWPIASGAAGWNVYRRTGADPTQRSIRNSSRMRPS